jgi:uncharacterized protein
MKPITASDLYNFTKCAQRDRVYLDAHGDPKEKSDVSPFVKLLWELGLQTEREYLAAIGEVPVSDLQTFHVEQAWPETLRLMRDGAPLIYQGCLIDGPYVGRPDLLLKRNDLSSSFGPYGYEPRDS